MRTVIEDNTGAATLLLLRLWIDAVVKDKIDIANAQIRIEMGRDNVRT